MYKRIVIKVGTGVLTIKKNQFNLLVLKNLVKQIAVLKNKGVEIVLVSSGAIGAGRGLIESSITGTNAQKQVLSAVGQVSLMSAYAKIFGQHGQICAQVLATKEDFRDKIHYFNMRTCFENLLASGVIPVVNENDVMATIELLFTDNDELAGLVAAQINADVVIILTSVAGFLSTNSRTGKTEVVPEINYHDIANYQSQILTVKTKFGRGSMLTKFEAAKKLTLRGIAVHIIDGKEKDILLDLFNQNQLAPSLFREPNHQP